MCDGRPVEAGRCALGPGSGCRARNCRLRCRPGHIVPGTAAMRSLTAVVGTGRARRLAVGLALARTGVGAACLAVPSLAALWVGRTGATGGGRVLSRSLAARDLALGAGTVLAAGSPSQLRTWVAMSALGDLADMGGTLQARDIPRLSRRLVAGASAVAVVVGAIAAASVDRAG